MQNQITKDEYLSLIKEMNFHFYRYHVLDAPLISDAEYDLLVQKLRQIESTHPEWIASDSPSQRAGGAALDKFEKSTHPKPILSLANAFSKEEILAWYERILKLDARVADSGFILEPKIDGLTVVLHYHEGIFTLGATRGDGLIGEVITLNLKTIKALPLHIPVKSDQEEKAPERLVVRGEAFINKLEFKRLNERLEENGEKTYQNPRNTAAGSLRQLDSTLSALRPLTLLTYAIVDSTHQGLNTQKATLEYLLALGFPVTPEYQFCGTIDSVVQSLDTWIEKRDALPYEIDGVVIKLDNLLLAEELGFVGKDPRGAVAFKFPAREKSTRLTDIKVAVGRTGVLTPNAVLEPIEIGGVIIKQATLHNFEFIREKDIRIGDRVLIKRAGDVIPYVMGPITEAREGDEKKIFPPANCPSCGAIVQQIPGEVAIYCVNTSCTAQLVRNIEHFVSKEAMDISGLGASIVQQLVENKVIRDIADLYTLTKEQLLELEGFAEKKAANLIAAVKISKTQTLPRLLTALGIRGVGETIARDVAHRFGDLTALSTADKAALTTIEGIGPNIADSIFNWFQNPSNKMLLLKLQQAGVWPVTELSENASNRLGGKTFVVTGTLAGFTRDAIKEYISNLGGNVSDSVSRNTDFLIAGENAGSKLQKAKELGIPVVDEQEFLKMTNG